MDDTHNQSESAPPELRRMPGRSLDIAVAGLGLLAFVVLMFLLSRWLFPAGVSLQDNGQTERTTTQRMPADHELSYSGSQGAGDATVAELVTVRRNVQIKAYDSLAWASAQQGLDLLDQDSLQTLSHSGATVRLEDSSMLKVGPNSLIVFQDSESDMFTPRRTNSLVMMEGTLSGEFASADGKPLHLEIALPNGLARFVPRDDEAAAAFNINVNPDLSSSVSVHAGKGIVSIGGRTVSIAEEHGVTISINGDVLEEGRLPELPAVMSPRPGAEYRYRDIPPPLAFEWRAVAPVSKYRLRLSRDEDMNDIVIDERLSSSRFSYAGLQDGTYYWQVSAMDGSIEGPAAGPNRLRLVRDVQAPSLELLSSRQLDGQVLVRGRTEPGSRVFIQGEAVSTDTGVFEKAVDIDPGLSLILVEAMDDAGNVAYESQTVNSKFSLNGGAR